MQDLKEIYSKIRKDIEKKIEEFEKNGNDEIAARLEFIFCLLTPQSKAETCWNAVLRLHDKNLIMNGTIDEIANELKGVRFKYNKARYIVEARKFFNDCILNKIKKLENKEAREWLVKNVKGYGYKEASHFLRNIGKGKDLAILDRHILKNLKEFEVIKEIPASMTRKKYLEIENKMMKFSEKLDIPMSHLDFVLWYKETGRIFK